MKSSRSLLLLTTLALAGWQTQAHAQASIDLGSAADFAVLAGSGITVTGAVNSTAINGDIGTFPTTTFTGAGNVVLTGTNHGGDSITQDAKTALSAAYADAVGRTPTTTYGAIYDLGGLTLTPGVYNDPSSFGITGTLTLDANGDANAVWIFQAGSTLITQSSSQVLLIDGAQAANVFWQVGTSATFMASSVFVGTVMAADSITLNSGATIDGRLLALNALVTLDTNTISVPTAIPEPATTAALVAGLMGLVIGGRRIRRTRAAT